MPNNTANKPWRNPALGCENGTVTEDDGNDHILVAAFKGWPPEGSVQDGNQRVAALMALINDLNNPSQPSVPGGAGSTGLAQENGHEIS